MSLVKGRLLGKGGFANCYEMYNSEEDQTYAAKVVHFSTSERRRKLGKMLREASLQRELCHPNIVRLYDWLEFESQAWMILELCEAKNAADLLEQAKVLSVRDAGEIMRQLCLGVEYLHGNGIVHRDIKLSNILFHKSTVKIGDFGLATLIRPGELKYKICGTPNYIAPEILFKTGYSFPVDIWSLGCVLYTLLVGRPPFESKTVEETYARIKRGHYPKSKSIPVDLEALLRKMLSLEWQKRPPVTSIRFRPSNQKLLEKYIINGKSACGILEKDSGCSVGTKSHDIANRNLFRLMSEILRVIADPTQGKPKIPLKSLKNVQVTWVKSWQDHPDGFIYKQTDGTIAMTTRGDTWAYRPESGVILFCSAKGEIRTVDGSQSLGKSAILSTFMNYLAKNKCKPRKDGREATMPTYIVYHMRLPDVFLFGLSDGTLQLTTLRDKTKLVFSPGDEDIVVTVISICRRSVSYYLRDAINNKALVNRFRSFQQLFEDLVAANSSSIYSQ